MSFFSKQIDKRIAAYQRELIETHYQEVENMYKSSETQLTAERLQRNYSSYYTCSNCEHTESHGYPPRAVNLGKYCPNCGSKMKNPKYVSVGFTY